MFTSKYAKTYIAIIEVVNDDTDNQRDRIEEAVRNAVIGECGNYNTYNVLVIVPDNHKGRQ